MAIHSSIATMGGLKTDWSKPQWCSDTKLILEQRQEPSDIQERWRFFWTRVVYNLWSLPRSDKLATREVFSEKGIRGPLDLRLLQRGSFHWKYPVTQGEVMLPKFLWTEGKAETCLWRCNEFFSGAGVLEMQSMPLCNNCFFSHSNHTFHSTRNGHEAPGDAQPVPHSAPNPLLYVTCLLAEVMNCPLTLFPPKSHSDLFAESTSTLPSYPGTKLSCSSIGCDYRYQNAEMSPCMLTNQHCWQSHYLMLQRPAKEKFSFSGGVSICPFSIVKLEFVSLTNLVLTILLSVE